MSEEDLALFWKYEKTAKHIASKLARKFPHMYEDILAESALALLKTIPLVARDVPPQMQTRYICNSVHGRLLQYIRDFVNKQVSMSRLEMEQYLREVRLATISGEEIPYKPMNTISIELSVTSSDEEKRSLADGLVAPDQQLLDPYLLEQLSGIKDIELLRHIANGVTQEALGCIDGVSQMTISRRIRDTRQRIQHLAERSSCSSVEELAPELYHLLEINKAV